jgi:hydroxyethylthiazole kinase-like uncharacterized protein yjeF
MCGAPEKRAKDERASVAMTQLLTSAQMRALEAAAIASGTVSGLDLMERAGQGVVAAVFAEWPALAAGRHRAAILCGPGNNGGDGFVVARLLHQTGWEVEVFLYGDPARLPPDARANCNRWRATGEIRPLEALSKRAEGGRGTSFDLIVDALFGIGLRRAVPKEVAATLHHACCGHLLGPVVSVDIPTGLCADSGRPILRDAHVPGVVAALDGQVAEADLTVTFHSLKPGHLLGEGPLHCGRVVVADIGLAAQDDPLAIRLQDSAAPGAAAGLSKGATGHKFTHGHALVLSGGVGRGGAARLAARGALRIGAGLVTVGCPPAALIENAARLDAVMLRPVADAAALAGLLADRRISALCLGPGLGVERAAGLLAAALPAGLATVIDADALTALAAEARLCAGLHPGCVLTPHGGEFARLFPEIAGRLEGAATAGPAYSKVDAARAAAARAGCVVLFKGPDTVIADPQGRSTICSAAGDRAAPWLATAGSGDVLAGFIAGLLARGFAPMPAAETAARLHVEAARAVGPGLIAEDLPEALPGVFRALGL